MSVRTLAAAAALVATLAVPTIAEAAVGHTTSSVRLRIGPSTSFPALLTIPRGARIEVGACSSWCRVTYRGRSGFISARQVSLRPFRPMPPPRIHRPPPPPPGLHRPPPPPPGWPPHPMPR